MKSIYCVYDLTARSIVGGLQVFNSDAAAVRMFSDAAGNPESFISKHVSDFDLLRLGTVHEEDATINAEPENTVVVTGAAWLAAQKPADAPLTLSA